MISKPPIETTRLRLHPLAPSDASEIQRAASAREIADSMISLPHPYPEGEARRYIAKQQAEQEAGRCAVFSIRHKVEERFFGLVELRDIELEHSQGELSFWLAVEVWGQGYMSEAIQTAVQYGFEVLDLNRLYAYHMLRNPASGCVLKNNGFRQEGLLRQRVRKWGKFEDVYLLALLRQDWRDQVRQ